MKRYEPSRDQIEDAKRRALAALAKMTDEEDAAILAAALEDPDTHLPSDGLVRRRRPRSSFRF